MRKASLLILILLGVTSGGWTQANADSLLGVWNNSKTPDNQRVQALIGLYEIKFENIPPDSILGMAERANEMAQRGGDPKARVSVLRILSRLHLEAGQHQRALDYADEGLKFSEELGDLEGASRCLSAKGRVYRMQGDHHRAEEAYNESLATARKTKDPTTIVIAITGVAALYHGTGQLEKALQLYYEAHDIHEQQKNRIELNTDEANIGMLLFFQGKLDESLVWLNKSLEGANEIDSDANRSVALGNLGMVYSEQGNYFRGIDCFTEALSIYERAENNEGVIFALTNIGHVYYLINDFEKSSEYVLRGYELAKKLGNKGMECHSIISLGTLTTSLGNVELALERLEEGLSIAKELGDNREISLAQNGIGGVYRKMEEFELALDHYQQAFAAAETLGARREMAGALIAMGQLQAIMGRQAEGMESFQEALRLSQATNAQSIVQEAAQGLYEGFRAQNNWKQSLDMLELYTDVKDSLLSEKNQKEVIRKGYEYEYEKQALADSLAFEKEQELTQLAHQAELDRERNQRYLLYGGLGFLLLLGGVVFRAYQLKKKDNKLISEQKVLVEKERDRSDELLLNILPAETARELKQKGSADARNYDLVTVLFTDFKGFTMLSERLSPEELVAEIDHCYKAFDEIMTRNGIEKIKTIGDAYMAAGGLPTRNASNPADTVNAALEIRDFMLAYQAKRKDQGREAFEIRIGCHTGPVVAGIVGIKKFAYDIWGDTVNTAARMESSGEVGKVNISGITHELVKDQFDFAHRGKVAAKNKGEIDMYFVEHLAS